MSNTLHIIHDDRRSEKYPLLIYELVKQKVLDYKIWQAVVLRESVVKSINASHKMIVRAARDLEWPYVIIAEDDLMFTDEGAWQYYLDNMPMSFDLYLGCTYVKPFSPVKVTGFHLYTVHENFYARFLSTPDDVHIDTVMDELNGDYRLCYPFPALQRAGFSSNNSGYADYNTVLTKDDLYKHG
jgi:hypothetical protein